MKILEQRLHKAPSFTKEMLRDKIFGTIDSDLEFRLLHFASSPLYSEHFDGNAALQSVLGNYYNAEAHSTYFTMAHARLDC
jgi:proline iminopeptidase